MTCLILSKYVISLIGFPFYSLSMDTTQTSMPVNTSITSYCYDPRVAIYISYAFCLTKLLLVTPFIVAVLFLGVRRWRRQQQQGCLPPAIHSDVFTYHVSVFEIINLFGYVFNFCGKLAGLHEMVTVGNIMLRVTFLGPVVFHILACVDRYLAVVCPVAHLRLRQSAGIRIRIISTVFVWLLSSGLGAFAFVEEDHYFYLLGVLFAIFLVIISTFSLHILCALKRAGPASMGVRRDRAKVSQSKQRAFHMVMAITVTLWMWFIGILLPIILMASDLKSEIDVCLLVLAGFWFSLPSNLVLPLLYLHRDGKQK